MAGPWVLTRLGLMACLGLPAQAQEPPYAQFRARCILATEGMELDPWSVSSDDDMLRRHAAAHGWQWDLDDPDLVASTPAVPCPERTLDRIVAAQAWLSRSEGDIFFARNMAQILERNGRVDSALALLSNVQKRARDDSSEQALSFVSEWAARLCAHAGRWEQALEYAKDWTATSWCGNCASAETARRDALVGRARMALHRYEEVLASARETAQSGWTLNLDLLEAWIDCELGLQRATDAEGAIQRILVQVPEDAKDQCNRALESWKRAHASREQQIGHLEELAGTHQELAVPILLSLSRDDVTRLMACFDVVDRRLMRSSLPYLLAELGFPEVGPALERAKGGCSEELQSTVNYMLESWRSSNERWKLLTEWTR